MKSTHEQVQLGFAVRWIFLSVSAELLQSMLCELELAYPIDVDNAVNSRIDMDLPRHNNVVQEKWRREAAIFWRMRLATKSCLGFQRRMRGWLPSGQKLASSFLCQNADRDQAHLH